MVCQAVQCEPLLVVGVQVVDDLQHQGRHPVVHCQAGLGGQIHPAEGHQEIGEQPFQNVPAVLGAAVGFRHVPEQLQKYLVLLGGQFHHPQGPLVEDMKLEGVEVFRAHVHVIPLEGAALCLVHHVGGNDQHAGGLDMVKGVGQQQLAAALVDVIDLVMGMGVKVLHGPAVAARRAFHFDKAHFPLPLSNKYVI